MIKVDITKNTDGYRLNGCPLSYSNPLVCQAKGCLYWGGYVFLNAYYYGKKDHVSSQWRKIMDNEVVVADYTKCFADEDENRVQENV
jgi:hypothetical protein